MAVHEDGHYGKYSGNARCCTKVTAHNYGSAVRDDAAHIEYLKEDINYDAHHNHSDIDMTADEKHISKLAGDMKYDKQHHGPSKHHGPMKPLKGDQHELPEHLQKAILDSPSKRYCVK